MERAQVTLSLDTIFQHCRCSICMGEFCLHGLDVTSVKSVVLIVGLESLQGF